MAKRLKHYILFGLALAAFYFLLSHHIVFSSFREFDLLKKQQLTMEYTFFSIKQADIYDVLRNDVLRDAGIENILLDRGLVTEEKLEQFLQRIDSMKATEG